MRDIKFRGKKNKSANWVYGYFKYDWFFRDGKLKPCIQSEHKKGKRSFVTNFIDIKTLGQFTGLQDKNGVDIYEYHEINFQWRVVYLYNRYILQSISNSDIFIEINNNEKYEITREYCPLEKD